VVDDKISLNFDALKEKINKILTKFNNSEVIIEEIKDWKKILLFLIDDKYRFYISSNGEEMKYYDSYEKQAECIIKMSPENIENLFNQKLGLTEAFRNKEISILGDSADFIKLTVLLDYLEDEQDSNLIRNEDDWQVGNPEDYDMDTSLLDKAAKKLKEIDINRNSLLIIKNGVLIYETYYGEKSFEKRKKMVYDVASITKTLASLVIGVAVTKGLITVRDFIHDWIPYTPEGIVPGSQVIHLLTHTSETEPPGTNFHYNSGEEINTLATILSVATEMPSKDFAYKNLCEIIGITEYSWYYLFRDQKELPIGWGLKIRPRDAARLGQLILQKGKWKGSQLVSEEYIEELKRPSFINANSGYGYLVWLNNSLGHWYRPFKDGTGSMIPNAPEDLIYASGFYGRFIFIIPSLDLVIVTFGKKFVWESLDTAREIYNAIEPALPKN
jgi:CubicO group peptidase (beta-lactamase class C family)